MLYFKMGGTRDPCKKQKRVNIFRLYEYPYASYAKLQIDIFVRVKGIPISGAHFAPKNFLKAKE